MKEDKKRFARYVVSITASKTTLENAQKTRCLVTNLMAVAGVHTVAISKDEKLAVIDLDVREGNISEALRLLQDEGYRCDTPQVSTGNDLRELGSDSTMKHPSAFSFRQRSVKQILR